MTHPIQRTRECPKSRSLEVHMEVTNTQHQIKRHKDTLAKRRGIPFTRMKQRNQAILVHPYTMVAKKFILQIMLNPVAPTILSRKMEVMKIQTIAALQGEIGGKVLSTIRSLS